MLGAIHPADVPAEAVIDAANEHDRRAWPTTGRPTRRCSRAAARFTASLYRESDTSAPAPGSLGSLELLHGRAELLGELPGLWPR